MTTKHQVDLDTYKKRPRLLPTSMECALGPGGDLHSVLEAVTQDNRLRLDIRDRRFNVYYGGGNLLLVNGQKSPWTLHFDEKYFRSGTLEGPSLPKQFSGSSDARAWVQAFPKLIAGMDDWWTRHPKGERAHCQEMAAANSAKDRLPLGDYLVLDLEYQWAQRRFDMVAAKRRPTKDDPTGWIEPDLVFIEVKSEYSACSGKAGLGVHANDYKNIITAQAGQCVKEIKIEYQNVVAQKRRLGLLDKSFPFKSFSALIPLLLIVLVDLEPNDSSLIAPLTDVSEVSSALGDIGRIQFMRIASSNYMMTDGYVVSVQRIVSALGAENP
ncbi:hypothetical protein HZA56_12325 [Candidatus Poribacteria bacterium]|nr:hypothetical protein [Candidatus Poribacteria bacterium]